MPLMKTIVQISSFNKRIVPWVTGALLLLLLMLFQSHAHASMFSGEALDTVADVMAWVVLVIAPVVAIAVFLMVHILPEKIAEKKKHPQTDAIKTLCLLSLAFGGMLWPLAWLWAYSKPVMYKLAYGTDKLEHDHDEAGGRAEGAPDAEELKRLRKQVAELETRLTGKPGSGGGKA
jgi:CBS domain containing-hemolysin-like protein